MTYPSADHPLILTFTGHIPALKNQKIPVRDSQGNQRFIPNQKVQQFYRSAAATCYPQVQRQGFDPMLYPTEVAVFAEFWFYVANKSNISASDGDNAYTTIQDMLMPSTPDKHPYYLNIVQDDKQIVAHHVEVYAVKQRQREGARFFIFMLDDRVARRDNWNRFDNFYLTFKQPVAITNQHFVDPDEMLDLLT